MSGKVVAIKQTEFHVKPAAMPRTVIVQLRREADPVVFHTLLGELLKRVRDFCDRFDADAVGNVLARSVEFDYCRDTVEQQYFALLAVKEGQAVGHLLARIVNYDGSVLAYVHQWQMDRPARLDDVQKQAAFAMVKRWAKEKGAKKVKAGAWTKRHARRLIEEFGFDSSRKLIMLEQEVL